MDTRLIISFLRNEVKPATGCTEPVAIALATAWAVSELQPAPIKRIELVLSANVYKNSKAVGIPRIMESGVDLAAFLGVSIRRPNLDLTIFDDLDADIIKEAKELRNKVFFKVNIGIDLPSVYIAALVETEKETGKAVIAGKHTNLVFLEKNKRILLDYTQDLASENNAKEESLIHQYPLRSILEKAMDISVTEGEFLLEGITMNLAMAEKGFEMQEGLGIGKAWKALLQKGYVEDDILDTIALYTAAASDARMAGVSLPVMSSAGSGNHGLVAILPLAIVAKRLESSKEDLIRSLAVSHLVTIYVRGFTGRLSPICGCAVASGAGASAGLVNLLGGDYEAMENAAINVISSLAGLVCDGCKVGCALKLCSSATTAWYSAILACEKIRVPQGNGIVDEDIEKTLLNLRKISAFGMENMDKTIIAIVDRT